MSNWRSGGAIGHQYQSPTGKDGLTGLADRSAFLRRMQAEDAAEAVVLVDLDGLRAVNRALGYAVGDRLLRMVAERLAAFDHNGAALARLDGDLFALLVRSRDPQAVTRTASAIAEALAAPWSHGGMQHCAAVSIGITVSADPGIGPEELLAQAQFALRIAKRAGGGCIRVFEPGMVDVPGLSPLAGGFALACAREEWELHYQPQVSLSDGALVGMEGLLRWQHPAHGLLAPCHFIRALEGDGCAPLVGRWILDRACGDLQRWRQSGFAVPRVAVNVFSAHLESGTFQQDVMAALARHGLAASDLELEITETVALASAAAFLTELEMLRAAGMHIALDDFGTGFACLTTLRQLPLTCLKIDRSFIAGMAEEPKDLAVVRALISIATDLELRLVAEGVETQAQADLLRSLGCHQAQGYYYSRALGPSAIEQCLTNRRGDVCPPA